MQRQKIAKSRNGTLDEHARERQNGEEACRNAQGCVIVEKTQKVNGVMRDQSSEDNDDYTERACHSYRK